MNVPTKEGLEAQRSLRKHAATVAILTVALFGGMGGWAASTSLSSAVIASGTVVVENNVKKIQHPTGGVVKELFVKEGDRVKAGQILLRLDATARSDLSRVENQLAKLYAEQARLEAIVMNRPTIKTPPQIAKLQYRDTTQDPVATEKAAYESQLIAQEGMRKQLKAQKQQLADQSSGIAVQLDALDKAIKLNQDDLETTQMLYNKRVVSNQRLLELKRTLVEQEGNRGTQLANKAQINSKISEIELQILQIDQNSRKEANDKLSDVNAQIAEAEQLQITAKDQLTRIDVVSPIAGRVFQVAVHTINGVIGAGDTLMLVSPESEALMVEASILPTNIDQVYLNQHVQIRFTAFDQKTTPEIEGEIIDIAPDLSVDQKSGKAFYPLRIRPDTDKLKALGGRQLYPGMPAEVFIKIADRTVLSYFAKPLADRMNHVFREE